MISSYFRDDCLVPALDMQRALPFLTVLQCIIDRVSYRSCRFGSFWAAPMEVELTDREAVELRIQDAAME